MFEEQVIQRLVALNHQRSSEEKRGIIRWLRPEYQNKAAKLPQPEQTHLPGTETAAASSSPLAPVASTTAWPAKLSEQVALIRQLLTADPTSTPENLSARFGRKNAKRIEQIEGIIETLRGLGQI
ncbi:MAG: hypothetical protein MUF31_17205 [Akkermansiaceae bacterium]|jgi:hypothetical protein|nr:hypothetical protein [Akkermansiaceae bacterium]